MSIYTNDNVNDSFRKEPDAGKPHVRFCEGRALRGVRLLDPICFAKAVTMKLSKKMRGGRMFVPVFMLQKITVLCQRQRNLKSRTTARGIQYRDCSFMK